MVKHIMRLGTLEQLRTKLGGLAFTGKINTAFVERVNLTIRRSIAGLARQTWATAQTTEHLLAQAEVWRAYYHFVRVHEGLRLALAEAHKSRPRSAADTSPSSRLEHAALEHGRVVGLAVAK